MRHDPDNRNCDRNQYGDVEGVLCSCDVDSPDDAPMPSTVMAPALVARLANAGRTQSATLERFEASVRALDLAKKAMAPAEAEWRAALDALHAEILGR